MEWVANKTVATQVMFINGEIWTDW